MAIKSDLEKRGYLQKETNLCGQQTDGFFSPCLFFFSGSPTTQSPATFTCNCCRIAANGKHI